MRATVVGGLLLIQTERRCSLVQDDVRIRLVSPFTLIRIVLECIMTRFVTSVDLIPHIEILLELPSW
jgi:hypothetical protein